MRKKGQYFPLGIFRVFLKLATREWQFSVLAHRGDSVATARIQGLPVILERHRHKPSARQRALVHAVRDYANRVADDGPEFAREHPAIL